MREWTDHAAAISDADEVVTSGGAVIEKLDAIESRLVANWQTTERGQFGTPLPKLAEALASLVSLVESADSVPTKSSYEVFYHLSGRIAREIKALRVVVDQDIAAFVRLLREAGVPNIGTR